MQALSGCERKGSSAVRTRPPIPHTKPPPASNKNSLRGTRVGGGVVGVPCGERMIEYILLYPALYPALCIPPYPTSRRIPPCIPRYPPISKFGIGIWGPDIEIKKLPSTPGYLLLMIYMNVQTLARSAGVELFMPASASSFSGVDTGSNEPAGLLLLLLLLAVRSASTCEL